MTEKITKNRLKALAWAVVFMSTGFLECGTVATLQRIGLVGARPPLSAVQTAIRVLIAIVALALLFVFHRAFHRIALLVAAAAATSTALYGLGLRSAWLSAFRLLSHLTAYFLIMLVSGVAARRELKGSAKPRMPNNRSNGS
jgi:hypothetical protein